MESLYRDSFRKNIIHSLSNLFNIDENGSIVLKKKLVVYDLETTNIDPIKDDITQVAYATFDENFNLIKAHSTYCKLKSVRFQDINPEIVRKTKISKEKLDNGENVEKAITDLVREANDAILMSFNGWGFDDRFITAKMYKYVTKNPYETVMFNSHIDTMLLAIGAYFKTSESMSLRNVARLADIEFDESLAHDATYDVMITAAVLPGIIRSIVQKLEDYETDCILRMQLRNFQKWRFERFENPYESTPNQVRFATSLAKGAYYGKDNCLSSLEWGLSLVMSEEDVKKVMNEEDFSVIENLKYSAIKVLIEFLLYLKGLGVKFKFLR